MAAPLGVPMMELASLHEPMRRLDERRREPAPSVPAELQPLMSRIAAVYRPLEVWLFGSRAREEADSQSDWDLMVIVSDETSEDHLDPMFGWKLQQGSGVYADIICARVSEFDTDLRVANTAAREVARDGVLLYAA